ncbi:MAG: bifunctional riboflavin kinase/FAD synthetase [Chlamydiales bacterium]
MKTIYRLEDFKPVNQVISITIGNFDGVHLGHQAILSNLKGQKVVFSFLNPPFEVVRKQQCLPITTISHRLHLLEIHGVDTTILVSFTKPFSKQSPKDFLSDLKKNVPFSDLILGHDAAIGNERKGNKKCLSKLALEMNFHLKYLEPVVIFNEIVSSSRLRKLVTQGAFQDVETLLGRPYSIRATVEPGQQKGSLLGFPTMNLKIDNLCLPPFGVYIVQVEIFRKKYLGVANLGCAPTLHTNRSPILEVHLIHQQAELYGKEIEVYFIKFLRKEIHFNSIEALKNQIKDDVKLTLLYAEKAIN